MEVIDTETLNNQKIIQEDELYNQKKIYNKLDAFLKKVLNVYQQNYSPIIGVEYFFHMLHSSEDLETKKMVIESIYNLVKKNLEKEKDEKNIVYLLKTFYEDLFISIEHEFDDFFSNVFSTYQSKVTEQTTEMVLKILILGFSKKISDMDLIKVLDVAKDIKGKEKIYLHWGYCLFENFINGNDLSSLIASVNRFSITARYNQEHEMTYFLTSLHLSQEYIKLGKFQESEQILTRLTNTKVNSKVPMEILVDIWIYQYKLTKDDLYLKKLKLFEQGMSFLERQKDELYFLDLMKTLREWNRESKDSSDSEKEEIKEYKEDDEEKVKTSFICAQNKKFGSLKLLRIDYLLELFDTIPDQKIFYEISKTLSQIICINLDSIFKNSNYTLYDNKKIQDFDIKMENKYTINISQYKMMKFFLIDSHIDDEMEREKNIASLEIFIDNMKYIKSLNENVINSYIYSANKYLEQLKKKIEIFLKNEKIFLQKKGSQE